MATSLPKSQQWKLGTLALLPYDVDISNNLTVAGTTAFTGALTSSGALTITSTSANALAVGRQGATAPVLKINANTASVATGIEVTGAAAASGVALAAISSGTNENLSIDAKGTGDVIFNATAAGNITLDRNLATLVVTNATANGFVVGPNGVTNPAFQVDTATASSATGIKVKSAAAAGGVAVSAVSSGTDEALTINAKGAGTIGIGSVSTGAVTITPATAVTGALTPTGGVAAAGGFSASPRHIWTGSSPPKVSTDGNDSTPVTTETYVSEVFVPCNMTITGVALFNGSNVTGNVTVGLATSAGAPIAAAKSASTAGSGTDAMQLVPFATPYAAVGPAVYYIQVQYDSGTARYNTHVLGNHGVLVQTSQVYGTLASFTPPTTFVTAVGNIAALY